MTRDLTRYGMRRVTLCPARGLTPFRIRQP
jgi:hypothetical protein